MRKHNSNAIVKDFLRGTARRRALKSGAARQRASRRVAVFSIFLILTGLKFFARRLRGDNTSTVIRGLGNFTPIPVVGYVGTCSQNWETLHFLNLGDLEAEVPKPVESDLGNLWDFTPTCSRM